VIDASAHDRHRERLDTVVGLMAATAIVVGILSITNLNLSIAGVHFQMRPVRIDVATVTLALVAAGIGGRHRRLAAVAVGVAGVSWMLAMVVAVVAERPVF
jgi:hypothetical protein